MNPEPEIIGPHWPKYRDPSLAPFFVEEDKCKSSWYCCRIGGTFRNGITSFIATPIYQIKEAGEAPEPISEPGWCKWLRKEDAISIACCLNRLHEEGLIDWSWTEKPFHGPVIISMAELERITAKAA